MNYSIDENGFIKLAAMAPKQELGRQLELRSRLARSAGHSGVADNLSTLSGAVASPAGDVTGPMAAHSGLQSLLDSTKAVSSARLKELGMGRNFGDFHNTRAVAQDVLDRPEISRKSGKTDYNPLPKTKPLPTYKKASYTVENGLIKLADKFTERMHAVKRPQRAEAREQARKAQGRSTAAEGADIRARAAEETASKRQDAARRRAAEASKYDDQFGLSYHARTGKNPPKLASYEIDENGLIKLSAMAPQQELSRQLLVASRHPKATPADRARLEQRSNRLGLGQLLPPENLKAMEGRIHGVSGQGLTELGHLSLPKTASFAIDGFIKLAASPAQSLALQSMRVSNRRPAAPGSVKRMPTIYELKQRIGAMSPADKARNRASMLKAMGVEPIKSSPLGKEWAATPKPNTPQVVPEPIGMTETGTSTTTQQVPTQREQKAAEASTFKLPLAA